ncbi:MAG TPA: sigma-70 family RNA polymerase sigma factor [Verrucomicrobiales bacterium]|nr:sigma-70 family RNA polymerase sigma factor [Verrucomicrobiales bacterium]
MDRAFEAPEISGDDAPSTAPDEDILCMLRVKEGDEVAFEELVRRHQGSVVATAYQMLGDLDEAHDIAQQVFIRIWKSASRWEPQARFTTWMFTIARNLVFNESRRRQRKPSQSIETQPEDQKQRLSNSGEAGPDELLLQREMQEAIDRAIEALPEQQRLAMVLRRFEMLPYEEIASVMSTSVPAVKSLLFRARTQLRRDLGGYLDG